MTPADALREAETLASTKNNYGGRSCKACKVVLSGKDPGCAKTLTVHAHHPGCPFAVLWDTIGETR